MMVETRLGIQAMGLVIAMFGLFPVSAAGQSPETQSVTTSVRVLESTPIAETTSGPITVRDLVVYSSAVNWPYKDPLQVLLEANRTDVRADAADYVQRAVREILFVRHYAEVARQKGFVLTQEEMTAAGTLRDNCIEITHRLFMDAKITTVPAEQYDLYAQPLLPQLLAPEQREVLYIFQEVQDGVPGRKDGEVRDRLEKVRQEIVTGKLTFQDAAIRYSEAESAKKAGRIGPVLKTSPYSPRFVELVFSTSQRQISPVTRLGRGYYLVYVESIIQERTLDSQRAELDGLVLRAYRDEQIEKSISAARRAYPVSRSPQDALRQQQIAEGRLDSLCEALWTQSTDLGLAYRYYNENRLRIEPPSDEASRKYYSENDWIGKTAGFWKLTRVRVLAGPGQPYPSTARAEEVLRRLWDEANKGVPLAELPQRFPGLTLEVDSTADWVRSTDHGPSDRELVKLPVGGITKVHLLPNEVFFFRKDEQREVPVRPFEEMRGRVNEILLSDTRNDRLAQDRQDLFARYEVKEMWTHLLSPEILEELRNHGK